MKKNKLFCVLLSAFVVLQGCKTSKEEENITMKNQVNEVSLYGGHIQDDSGENAHKVYKVKTFVKDKYYMDSSANEAFNIYDAKGKLLKENGYGQEIDIEKNKTYFIEVKTKNPYESIDITFNPIHNKVVTPYEINSSINASKYSTKSLKEDPLQAAKVNMVQRKGGTYLYSNIPERMPKEVLNTVIMRNPNLTGECFMTFEHQNQTGVEGIYMGYRIKNVEDHDIYVTVMNVGYQTTDSWLGDRSWKDYYGVRFDVDESKFRTDTFMYDNKEYTAQEWQKAYLNFDYDYVPNPIEPITYKLPAGKHMYVIGGTTKDAYNQINVNNTANIGINLGHCVNGNVRFNITNGKAVGDLCVYKDLGLINNSQVRVQNLRKYDNDDFGGRCGSSPIHGVIDNNVVWEFNDESYVGELPVTYQNYYADKLKDSYEPFEQVTGCTYHTIEGTRWYTHLSAQLNHKHCGTDMVDMHTFLGDQPVTLSNYIANPTGQIWDFGNWMIEYQENCLFVNHGNENKKIRYYLRNSSSIFYMIKDKDNNIIKSGATVDLCSKGQEVFEMIIPPHTKKEITVQFVLPANTAGNVEHYVKLQMA